MSESHVERAVQERIAAAKRRAAEQERRRKELAEARKRGLAYRHSQRLRNLAEAAFDNTTYAASGA